MSPFKLVATTALLLVIVGLAGLWLVVNDLSGQVKNLTSQLDPDSSTTTREVTAPTGSSTSASTNLQASVSGLLARVEELEASMAAAQLSSQTSQTQTTTGTSQDFQKQVIYLGSDTTTSRDWSQTGVEVTINSTDYPANVTATLQAGLSIGNGQAWARVTNKTTGAIISLTEVWHDTSTTTWKSSPEFKLHSGVNTYVIELRSTSGETAHLSGARLVIEQDN